MEIDTAYEKRAFIAAAGQVIIEDLPENYDSDDWSHDEYDSIDEWLEGHAWQPYEHWSAKQLWEQIDSVAYTLKQFHKNELKLSKE